MAKKLRVLIMAGNKRKEEKYLYMEQPSVAKLIHEAYEYSPIQGLLWDIVFNGGLRISEALAIKPSDVDFKSNKIKIHTLKQRSADVIIDEILFPNKIILICSKIVSAYRIKPNDKIFDMTRQWAWKMFKTFLKSCTISDKYSPHALRHSHGILVSEATKGDIVKIAKRLRHRSHNNAWRYMHLTDTTQQEIVDYINKIKR